MNGREIKFRAFIKKLKWMVPVVMIDFTYSTVEVDLSYGNGDTSEYDFDEVELMQSAGLHDTNGKEIYEGDILKAYKHNETEFIGMVKHRGGSLWFGNWNWVEFQNIFRNIEVVGNVHENKELLEVAK